MHKAMMHVHKIAPKHADALANVHDVSLWISLQLVFNLYSWGLVSEDSGALWPKVFLQVPQLSEQISLW